MASITTTKTITTPKIKNLYVYPIKSFKGITLQNAIITERGLAIPNINGNKSLDRLWCVCDTDGYVQDIRVQPHFATISIEIDYEHNCLVLTPTLDDDIKEFDPLKIPIHNEAFYDNSGEERVVNVSDRYKNYWYGHPLNGYNCGEEAANWITRFIHKHNEYSEDQEFLFLRYKQSSKRRISEMFKGKSDIAKRAMPNDQAAFADCSPFHLISTASMLDLNRRLPANASCENPVSIFRFRPNIEVGCAKQAYDEDKWMTFNIGKARFRQLGPTGRCVIPTTSPMKGKRYDDEEPRATLMKYRPLPYGDGPHGGPILGIWMAPQANVEQHVTIGDVITEVGNDPMKL
jgi:uncharacterized protein